MSHPRPEPPRLAISLLRVCCKRARLEEIEGDLYELFARRAARLGLRRAGQRYAIEACGVCLRQVSARVVVALSRSWRVGRIALIIVLALATAFMLIANDRRWAIMTGYALLFVMGILELLVYARAALSLLKALMRPARERSRRD